MLKKEKTIKNQARNALSKGNWPTIVGCLVMTFITILLVYWLYLTLVYGFDTVNEYSGEFKKSKFTLGYVFSFSFIILLLAVTPVINGFYKMCYNIAKDNSCQATDLFYYFSKPKLYFSVILLNLTKFVLIFIISLLCMLPSTIFSVATQFTSSEMLVLMNIISFILTIMGIIAIIILLTKFIFTNFILADDENKTSLFYIKASFKLSKGHTIDILKLLFSFIPWIAACFFILPIFYVVPYMGVSIANSAKWLILLKKEERPHNVSITMYDSI